MSGILASLSGSAIDTLIVSNGVNGTTPGRHWGYDSSAGLGSIAPTTSRIYSGASVVRFYKVEADGVYFVVAGLQANSGWTQVLIGSQAFQRSSATYSQGGGNTTWYWAFAGLAPPFANSGQTACVFT